MKSGSLHYRLYQATVASFITIELSNKFQVSKFHTQFFVDIIFTFNLILINNLHLIPI